MEPSSLELGESARRMGALRWAEHRLFEVLGAAVPRVGDPELTLLCATQARHHAWRAELLGDRLPEVGEWSADAVTVAPSVALAALFDTLAAPVGDDLDLDLAVAVTRVMVPRLLAAHRREHQRCAPVADAAVERTLRLVIADETEDLLQAQALLERLLDDESTVRRAAEIVGRVEAAWVAAGGIAGR